MIYSAEINNLDITYRVLRFISRTLQSYGQFDLAFGIDQQILQLADDEENMKMVAQAYLYIA